MINRLLDFCLTTSLERGLEMNEPSNVNKLRSILRDGIVRNASDVCLANIIFLNIELAEKIVEPLSWATQNDGAIIHKVYARNNYSMLSVYLK